MAKTKSDRQQVEEIINKYTYADLAELFWRVWYSSNSDSDFVQYIMDEIVDYENADDFAEAVKKVKRQAR